MRRSRRRSTTSQNSLDLEASSLNKPIKLSKLSKFFHSWQFSVTGWLCLTIITLLINLSFSIAVVARSGFQSQNELLAGDCARMQKLNSVAHFFINVLSTCILAGSSYCMQCLCAPTRRDVDYAHLNGVALDIGIPSFRNLKFMAKRRFAAWLLFAVSSLPLHLFYNSIVYSSLEFNDYSVVVANDEFLDMNRKSNVFSIDTGNSSHTLYTISRLDAIHETDENFSSVMIRRINDIRALFLDYQLRHLEPVDCAQAYARDFVSAYGNVVVVPQSDELSRGIIYYELARNMDWMCSPTTDFCEFQASQMIDDPGTNFLPFHLHVDHCMAQPMEQVCKLNFDSRIAMIVLFFNATKIVLMFALAHYIEMPLLTAGDGLASFLKTPDAYTRGNCLYNTTDFEQVCSPWIPRPLRWTNYRMRWLQAPGWARWLQFLVPFFLAYGTAIILMCVGMRKLLDSVPSTIYAFRLGLNSIRSLTVLNYWSTRPDRLALLANTPQLILSLIYFAYNAVLTIMLTSKEWTQLALQRKGLRVSQHPRGLQRTTYFLQLPYRYSAPLIVASGILHWLVTEALHLVASNGRLLDSQGKVTVRDTGLAYSIGWSPLALLLVLLLSGTMLLALMLLGVRKYASGMPLGGNNSLVLAAACHPAPGMVEKSYLSYRKVKWGVVSRYGSQGVDEVGHCAITSDDVDCPVEGNMYA